jgi:cell division septal protein FtsQ
MPGWNDVEIVEYHSVVPWQVADQNQLLSPKGKFHDESPRS